MTVNWAPSNSGTGRYEFTNQTTDFAVSDVGYVGSTDTTPPSFDFNFIPITAGGIAFMYNVPGLSKQLQLSSRTACGLLTGGITKWNDPAIAADNPGVSLPNVPVIPVTESDSAGTNYVLEEWCIDEQPALWAAFVSAQDSQSGGRHGGHLCDLPQLAMAGNPGGLNEQSTTSVVSDVDSDAGAIGAVQVKYAQDDGFRWQRSHQERRPGEERERRLHGSDAGRRGLGLGLRHAAAQRHAPAQFRRSGSPRLQPLDLQLPADPDDGVVAGEGRHHEPVRQLRPHVGPAGRAVVRVRQPGSFARAVRRQCRAAERAGGGRTDRGRTAGVFVR